MTLAKFLQQFPDEAACLDYIFETLNPKGKHCCTCIGLRTFTKIKKRPVYQCSCGYQRSPLRYTIFYRSKLPIRHWLYIIFVMSNTRSGVSAMQIKRELGCTYVTAWKAMHKIRSTMREMRGMLKGIVEIDETYLGMRGKNTKKPQFSDPKTAVFGMVERKGRLVMRHVSDNHNKTLFDEIEKYVEKNTTIYSDQYPAYMRLPTIGYPHDYVIHRREYVKKGTDVHTQAIEGVWSILKRGIYGVYRVVSKKHLQTYLDEFSWRYNYRNEKDMFTLLVRRSSMC